MEPSAPTDARRSEIESLERAFWQSLVDNDPKAASSLLTPTALMVSAHGAMSFDPATYEKMASDPKYRLLDYSFSDMDVLFPTSDVAIATYRAKQKVLMDGKTSEQDVYDSSTWIKVDDKWKCVAHTESEARPM
ncbi:MAG: nuclear transport factor 2 family protein [Pseudomonadota bacterium]|nr:nuclear transport factor 2 family protein [Pseudomonadota bacterium]